MKRVIVLLLVVFGFSATFAQSSPKKLSEYNLEKRVAIQGYDPVSYFKQNKAMKGKKEIFATYDGVIYQFSSATNKEAFLKNPASFEPQYGGWCAYAMGSAGEKVEITFSLLLFLTGSFVL